MLRRSVCGLLPRRLVQQAQWLLWPWRCTPGARGSHKLTSLRRAGMTLRATLELRVQAQLAPVTS
jgi:hypothetical protein